MWTDATYVVEKFKPGIHPNNNLHFVKPESWFNSAEGMPACSMRVSGCKRARTHARMTCRNFVLWTDAIQMLEQERRGLKQASLDKQNLMSRTLLQTNRLISTRLRGARRSIQPACNKSPQRIK